MSNIDHLKHQIKLLETVEKPRLVEQISVFRSEDGLSKTFDQYLQVQQQLDLIDQRLTQLYDYLDQAQNSTEKNQDQLKLGTKVTLKNGGPAVQYQIVGQWQVDPLNKKISIDSPIGQAIIDKQAGDSISVTTPRGPIHYQILAID
jgi:transcription elongation factor GreA